MARNVSISVPHKLGENEARRRIDNAVKQLSNKYAQHVSLLEAEWIDNRLTGELRALGQTVTGHVAVTPGEVQVRLVLPLLMSVLSGKIEAFTVKAAQRILS